jgi:fido (protein-threonine AMPylation protein)
VGGMNSEWVPIKGESGIDPSRLRDKTIKTRSQLAKVEFVNIIKVTNKYLSAPPSARTAPFDEKWMRKLHEEMFGDVWQWAGDQRTIELSLGVAPEFVGQELGGLALDIRAFRKDESQLLEQTVIIHHRGVHIHPFRDGNGRWARMLANIWLRRHGGGVINWPNEQLSNNSSPIRGEYIKAVKAADDYDLDPLTKLHEQYWDK